MKEHKDYRVAIVIPAYNEAGMIGQVVLGLREVFSASPYDYRVIVVDDGSKDETGAQAAKAKAYVITHVLNTGSGGATATGLSYAQAEGFDVAVTFDADGQHNPHDALKGVTLLIEKQADLLIGSRLIDSQGMSRVKVLGNRGLSFVTYMLFGIRVTDSQSGLRIFSKRALDTLRWKTSGYEFCSEMLWRAHQLNLDIQEYPIKAIYTEYSKGKGQNNWNAFNIVKSLLSRRIMELFGE